MTGDVEISPVVICHNGLSISTVTPSPVPTMRNPLVTEHDTVAVSTDGTNGNLQDLVNAMEQLKVPAQDRIDIIKELYQNREIYTRN